MMMLDDTTCVSLEQTVSNASLCFLTTVIAGDIFVAVDKWKNARLKHPKATSGYNAAVGRVLDDGHLPLCPLLSKYLASHLVG